ADEDPTRRFGSCCSPESVDDARQVARRLGIPHYLLNTEREFDRAVIAGFVDEYRAGRTPVPCVGCNRDIKFGSLLHRARAWDAVAVATGHYARITHDGRSGRHLLWRGADPAKDPSAFLWPLTPGQLAAARFPVGHLTEAEARRAARRLDRVPGGKPEQDRPTADQANFIACDPPREPRRVAAKIRHNHAAALATIRALEPARVEVVFDQPQRAVTPGQSVVFYDGDCVIGGGVIQRGPAGVKAGDGPGA